MTKPAISILMANYNKGKYIGRAIESVLEQTCGAWQLVIIDDCSTDNSRAVIKEYSRRDNRISFFQNPDNIGTALTQERLMKQANSDIVGILDSDDVLADTALEKVMTVFGRDKSIDFVYTQNFLCDENLHITGPGFSGMITHGKSNLHVNRINHFKAFKKEAFYKTKGYDSDMKMAEDIDLILKLEEVAKIYHLSEPLYYYRVLKKSNTHSFKREMVNRSSTALAKLNAYKRRLGTDIPNLDKNELAEVLFFGIFTALLSSRLRLAAKLALELIKNNPFFFLLPKFYSLLIKKIKKIIKLKYSS